MALDSIVCNISPFMMAHTQNNVDYNINASISREYLSAFSGTKLSFWLIRFNRLWFPIFDVNSCLAIDQVIIPLHRHLCPSQFVSSHSSWCLWSARILRHAPPPLHLPPFPNLLQSFRSNIDSAHLIIRNLFCAWFGRGGAGRVRAGAIAISVTPSHLAAFSRMHWCASADHFNGVRLVNVIIVDVSTELLWTPLRILHILFVTLKNCT